MTASRDLIVVVPPGTRVRYAVSRYIDEDGFYVVDASKLLAAPPPEEWFGGHAATWGLPVFAAEQYEP